MTDRPLDRFCQRFQAAAGREILRDEPMSRHTTFRIGGPAEALLLTSDEQEIGLALQWANEMGIAVTVMGRGSNLLVSAQGVEGLVLKVAGSREAIRKGNCLEVNAGEGLAEACEFARREGLGGLDALVGIPGTLGGAICMNAGAFGKRIGDRVLWVEALSRDGEKRRFTQEECEFKYRGSLFSQGEWVICRLALGLETEEPASIRDKMREWMRQRRESHSEDWICAGCVFKNPASVPAGRLIDQVGCKGLRMGDALISERHANIIVNVGQATFQDVLALMAEARRRVFDSEGVVLEPEVVIIGKGLPQPLFPPLGERVGG